MAPRIYSSKRDEYINALEARGAILFEVVRWILCIGLLAPAAEDSSDVSNDQLLWKFNNNYQNNKNSLCFKKFNNNY